MVEGEAVGSGVQAVPDIFFRPAGLEDLEAIAALEAAGYPPDEAASKERLAYRLQHAGGQFLAAVGPSSGGGSGLEIAGFCCGTLSTSDRLTEESMAQHEPEGSLLAIHSVCVAAAMRRRRVATRLLRAYLQFVLATTPQLQEVRLICKEPLIPLYAGAGFQMVGPSDVVHGKDPWYEMRWAPDEEEGEEEEADEAAAEAGQQQHQQAQQNGAA